MMSNLQIRSGAITTHVLDRPEKLNALNYALIDALAAALEAIAADAGVRAVIVTGAGRRAFSAGAGLKLYLPNAEVRVLERAGHFPDLEDIAAFATAVDDILTACGGPSLGQAP